MPGNSAHWTDGIPSSLPCLMHGETSATRGNSWNSKGLQFTEYAKLNMKVYPRTFHPKSK